MDAQSRPGPSAEPAGSPAPTPRGPGVRVPKVILLVTASIVAAIVIALVVAVAVPDEPTKYPAGSPEAAFQDFYQAFVEGDADAAYAGLSTSARTLLTEAEYRNMFAHQAWQRTQDRRLVLLGTVVTGERAVLNLRVDHFSQGGLTGNRYSEERSIRLVLEDGAWLVDDALVGIDFVAYSY